jgi:hypothetical protein
MMVDRKLIHSVSQDPSGPPADAEPVRLWANTTEAEASSTDAIECEAMSSISQKLFD